MSEIGHYMDAVSRLKSENADLQAQLEAATKSEVQALNAMRKAEAERDAAVEALRDSEQLVKQLQANQRTGRIIHGDALAEQEKQQ